MNDRISWDTPVSALVHSDNLAYIDLEEGELMHWKYIKREKLPNGKWRYYYDKEELKKDTKALVDKFKSKAKSAMDNAADRAVNRANKASSGLNTLVNRAKDAIGKFYDDVDNMYDVTRQSYSQKLQQIKQSKEWQDIVARKDKEYIKKNSDGSETHLIDDYLVDKKHPVLDAIGDIMAGREVTINEITKDSVVAGLKDYAFTGIEIGMMAVGFLTNGLVNKFKLSQGSYDEDIATMETTVATGADYISDMLKTARNTSSEDLTRMAGDAAKSAISNVDPSDIQSLVSLLATGAAVAKNTSDALSKETSDVNVVDAAMLIMESDYIKERVGSNEYYQQAEQTLSNLSDEEIMLINMLIQQMRTS